MNNGPTPISAGLASTPLSQQALESRKNAQQLANAKTRRADSICDTLETTDREADGRQPLESRSSTASEGQAGDHLDLTG